MCVYIYIYVYFFDCFVGINLFGQELLRIVCKIQAF